MGTAVQKTAPARPDIIAGQSDEEYSGPVQESLSLSRFNRAQKRSLARIHQGEANEKIKNEEKKLKRNCASVYQGHDYGCQINLSPKVEDSTGHGVGGNVLEYTTLLKEVNHLLKKKTTVCRLQKPSPVWFSFNCGQ